MRNFSNLFDLKDRVAVVTGGSRGLGAEIVKAYARQGADVVIASRKIDNCVAVAREVESETGRRAMPYSLHAGRWNEAEPFVDAVYNAFGRVDVLVNNAGMSPIYDKLADIPEQLFDSVVNLCFKGPFRLAVLFGDRMSASGGGSIINVSSIGSLRPLPSIIPYAGAKAALNAMTEGLARAYGPSVRVNTLMPGAMRTDIVKSWDQATFDGVAQDTALHRIAEPSELCGAAIFLASDASSYITGATIRVDGGIL